ncbi:hypothetical protein BB934_37170 (plasmid) [Microvirga ossetica]|uniref:Transposase DDE domain-containing protein n=1 Tax=Microvirga ossetica TaxID=1882682 RepID=A0A1B2EV53_9HYPH|nr:hypothetical protein [Microvirga ossetica]ANY83851.1 hypothetical protein BB934_37170 [Microvirga ossetica]
MPFKANAPRRHRILEQRHWITNWAGYDAALRQRGILTVWSSEEAIAVRRAEPRQTPGGQPHYSALAIRTLLIAQLLNQPMLPTTAHENTASG